MAMKGPMDSLESEAKRHREYGSPPLELWHPECNGDIPIFIDCHGDWYHDGGKIERHALVCLFASILRREDDGEYYLVTPNEKWRITVERHALQITDFNAVTSTTGEILEASLNTGRRLRISDQYPLFLDPLLGNIAALQLPHRLTAICTRPAWYRLVDMADSSGGLATLRSGSYTFSLPTE